MPAKMMLMANAKISSVDSLMPRNFTYVVRIKSGNAKFGKEPQRKTMTALKNNAIAKVTMQIDKMGWPVNGLNGNLSRPNPTNAINKNNKGMAIPNGICS